MVIITDANGNIQAPTIPENVYQGSNLANSITFLSPLPQSSECIIAFRLPNGLLTEPVRMTPYTAVPSQYNLNAWVCDIDETITALYGQVSFQIKVYSSGKVVASCQGSFPVLRGVPPILPAEPTTTIYEQILEALSVINGDMENGWFVSKGILPYDATFSYPAEATIFDKTTNSFYTSLVNDNLGNALTDTSKWARTYVQSKTDAQIQAMIDSSVSAHNSSTSAHQGQIETNKNDIATLQTAVNNKVNKQETYTSNGNTFKGKIENGKYVGGGNSVSVSMKAEFTNTGENSIVNVAPNGVTIGSTDGTSTELASFTKDEIALGVSGGGNQKILEVKPDGVFIDNKKVPTLTNDYSSSQDETYSANYVNSNFVPISFASRLYLKKATSTTATIEDAKPTTDAGNVLTTTTTNTSFDWSSPMITLTRTLERAITLNSTNSLAVDLYFNASRQANITFGAKIKVSTDNGSTWTYISSNQDFGAKSYINGLNSEDIVVYTDSLASPTTYAIGTLLAIEIFTKQANAGSLTLEYYCGVTENTADIYSFVEFNYANVNINTNQIEDGAITKPKLSSDLQDSIDKIGSASLDTTAQTLSGAVNELNTNKVSKTQIATENQAGLVYAWEDENGFHIWLTNPQEVVYTTEQNAQGGLTYKIKTLDYTEQQNAQGGLTVEIGEGE